MRATAEGSNNSEFLRSDGITSVSSCDGIPEDSPASMEVEPIVMVPFAIVDEIAEASPAAEDGLQLGDQIVKFGNVGTGDELLPRLASEAQLNQGRPVPMIIMRQGAVINLSMTPRPWHGRGLLGYACHLVFCCYLSFSSITIFTVYLAIKKIHALCLNPILTFLLVIEFKHCMRNPRFHMFLI